MSEFLIITGMSGAGRSTAARAMEDLGWFRVDNMPPGMFPEVAKRITAAGSDVERVAFVVGTAAFVEELAPGLDTLKAQGHRVRLLFLEASDEVLVRRFEGTRHRHPLAGELIAGSIAQERELLKEVRGQADIVLDTSDLNENELRRRIAELFSPSDDDGGGSRMQTTILSFGYKHGIPLDADVVLDCRFLPNPHWVPELRPLVGTDGPVRDYVLSQPESAKFVDKVDDLLQFMLPSFLREGKSYLTIAIGCTGGRHRSVALAEEIGRRLRDEGYLLAVHHRDVAK
jgi:UPF0042 nucleotide-binding protein